MNHVLRTGALAVLLSALATVGAFAMGSHEKAAPAKAMTSQATTTQMAGVSAIPLPAKPSKSFTFELITKSNASPYWLAVKEGADAAAKKYGVAVHFEAPSSGTDLSAQIGMVNNAVTSGVDGIILAAQNPSALLSPVRGALKAHIPVVTVDSGLSPNIADSFLATSNIGAAEALARYTAKHVLENKGGEYGIIDFNHTASTGIARPEGFEMGMKNIPNVKMVGHVEYSQNSIATGESEANNMLVQFPKMKVIFGANDRSALGPAEAIASSKSSVRVVGFDADLGEIKYVKKGIIEASILQSPYNMGYYAVVELIDIHDGVKVPKRVNTGFFLLTPKNLGSAQATKAIKQYAPSYTGA